MRRQLRPFKRWNSINFILFFALLLGVILCAVISATSLYVAAIAGAVFAVNGAALALFRWRVVVPADEPSEEQEEEEDHGIDAGAGAGIRSRRASNAQAPLLAGASGGAADVAPEPVALRPSNPSPSPASASASASASAAATVTSNGAGSAENSPAARVAMPPAQEDDTSSIPGYVSHVLLLYAFSFSRFPLSVFAPKMLCVVVFTARPIACTLRWVVGTAPFIWAGATLWPSVSDWTN
jgi:hypothetical protein